METSHDAPDTITSDGCHCTLHPYKPLSQWISSTDQMRQATYQSLMGTTRGNMRILSKAAKTGATVPHKLQEPREI